MLDLFHLGDKIGNPDEFVLADRRACGENRCGVEKGWQCQPDGLEIWGSNGWQKLVLTTTKLTTAAIVMAASCPRSPCGSRRSSHCSSRRASSIARRSTSSW